VTRRYLTELEVRQALGRGKSVAQFLGGEARDPFGAIIRWIVLGKDLDDSHVVSLYEAADVGSDTFFDIDAFPSIHGDDELKATFASFEEAVAYAREKLGAAPERFVNESMMGDEYADFRRAR